MSEPIGTASKVEMGRLAMRHEGDYWNAYYALPDTMAAAYFVASIRFAMVAHNPIRRLAFIQIAKGCVADIIEMNFGQRPLWDAETPAPEHEQAGNV